MSPEMLAISRNPDLLDNLGAEDLAKMSLEDPLLKWAYANVFLRSMGPFEQLEPPLDLVLADMRRRGEAVSPMLLKLISENQEHRIEFSILRKIEYLDTIHIEPFLAYSRKLLSDRVQSDGVAVASGLLARHGTKEDIAGNHHHQDEGDTLSRIKPWFIGGLILVVLLGLHRLLRKGLLGNSA
jgi:hypothetical protein